jgi:hypothetical protein
VRKRAAGPTLGALLTLLASTLGWPAAAFADEGAQVPAPARYVNTLTVGAPLRLTTNVDFDQSVLAPIYLDFLGGYVLSGSGAWRHGIGIGLSLNLSEDGGFTEPVGIAKQLTIMPSYLLYWEPSPAWLMLGHVGIPVLLTGGSSAGVDVGAGFGHRLLAGFGLYGEASVMAFTGSGSTVHPAVALELGVFLEHEVLP